MKPCRATISGVTVVELLVVIAIISVLAAIIFPAFASTKKQAAITDDLSRLRSCQLAVTLYRNDNDNSTALPFNLPTGGDSLNAIKSHGSFYGTTLESWTSACGWHPRSKTSRFVLFAGDGLSEKRFYRIHGEQSILLADNNCNDASVDVSADFVTKRGLGVLIDGTLLRRTRPGDVYSWDFWDLR